MLLAELIATEAGVPLSQVMLLRHSSHNVEQLVARGSSVEEYTFMQPTGSKYDYHHPGKERIAAVAVIVDDVVYAVYRVLGVEKVGTTYSLASPAHRGYDVERDKVDRPAKLFKMQAVPSASLGLGITGWDGRTRTTVQRIDGGFFSEIQVALPPEPVEEGLLSLQLERDVQKSLKDGAAQRIRRLATAARLPRRVAVTSTAFVRNADVIAEVLCRADGRCESCKSIAPFIRKSDGTPYLEVHHRVRLADGGEDTVANAMAVCPNCHRREHYA